MPQLSVKNYLKMSVLAVLNPSAYDIQSLKSVFK